MKFWQEFKAFISKGNIVDLAVAVVIGTAFNKIVSSLVNDIIMPLITWAVGANSLADLSIVLQRDAEGVATLTWNYGNFIQSVIDFLIIALTIFIVLKIAMKGSSLLKETTKNFKAPTKEEKAKLREMGVDIKDKHAVKEAIAEMKAKEKEEAEAAEKAKKDEAYKNSTEGLLKEIRDLLVAKQDGKDDEVKPVEEKAETPKKSTKKADKE